MMPLPHIAPYLEPTEVETPSPITALRSAMIALGAVTGSKYVHLEPRQAQTLFLYIRELEAHNARLQKQLAHLEDWVIDIANRNQQSAPMWLEERAE